MWMYVSADHVLHHTCQHTYGDCHCTHLDGVDAILFPDDYKCDFLTACTSELCYYAESDMMNYTVVFWAVFDVSLLIHAIY